MNQVQNQLMKMNLTKTQLVALGAAGAVAVIGLGSTVHAASVRHQNRLSYERQLEANLKEGNRLLTLVRDQSQKNLTENTLYSAGESLGQAIAIAPLAAQNMKQWNDVYYAYSKTYGQAQYDKWASGPSVEPLLQADNKLRAEIQKLDAETQAKNDAEMASLQRQFDQSMAELKNFQF